MRNKSIPQKRVFRGKRTRKTQDTKEDDKILMLMKNNKLMIPKEPVKRIISEIANDLYSNDLFQEEAEMNDVEKENEVNQTIWFKKEAYQVLHHAAESFMIDIFKAAGNISALKSKGSIEPIDIQVVLHSQQNNGLLITTMFTKDEILKQKKERYERKIKRGERDE